DNTGGPLVQAFRVGYVVTGGTNTVSSPAPNPYTSGLPVPTSTTQPVSFINPNTFQIISAGADGLYGWGGQYIANSTGDKLPANANGGQQRDREQDNLSNFATSRLD
ncbi:MAG: hypothetical protein IRY99_21075, partial [Isosphaeraceae bacterium]|nr:hypothetical protein [Isosphaeraceae bacterium]